MHDFSAGLRHAEKFLGAEAFLEEINQARCMRSQQIRSECVEAFADVLNGRCGVFRRSLGSLSLWRTQVSREIPQIPGGILYGADAIPIWLVHRLLHRASPGMQRAPIPRISVFHVK